MTTRSMTQRWRIQGKSTTRDAFRAATAEEFAVIVATSLSPPPPSSPPQIVQEREDEEQWLVGRR